MELILDCVSHIQEVVPVLLEWCSHLEDNDMWVQGAKYDCDDDDAAVAEEGLGLCRCDFCEW
tara:strand:+ start:631 stop:816 length:186 start_codon:yes stop_codon:yes gene_type:complete